MYTSTKTFTGLPCAHRQWRDEGHCSLVHGYDRTVIMTFGCSETDEKEWVVDFGGLKEVKKWLEEKNAWRVMSNVKTEKDTRRLAKLMKED